MTKKIGMKTNSKTISKTMTMMKTTTTTDCFVFNLS